MLKRKKRKGKSFLFKINLIIESGFFAHEHCVHTIVMVNFSGKRRKN